MAESTSKHHESLLSAKRNTMIIFQEDGSAIMQLGVVAKPVVRWQVWYNSPFGICADLKTLTQRLQQSDFPLSLIKPIVIAFDEDENYEAIG